MKIKNNYPISKIFIPQQFRVTPPRSSKINEKKEMLLAHPEQIYITLNYKGQLIDGYATYLAAKTINKEFVNIRQLGRLETFIKDKTSATTFVYGVHPGVGNKEYVWRITDYKKDELSDIKKGDKLIAHTKYGPAPIIVTKIVKKNYNPVDKKIRTIIGKAKY